MPACKPCLSLFFVAIAALLGCTRSPSEPAAVLQPAVAVTPPPPPAADQLRDRIDNVLDFTEHGRIMTLEKHAAWQLLHGVLAFGEKFQIQAEGKPVVAVDWVFEGKPMKGWTLTPTDKGVRAEIEAGKLGQGHDDQWLAILSQWNVPTDRPLKVAGKDYTVQDMVRRTMWDCYEGKESSWTVIALSKHLRPMDQSWTATDGQFWTIDRLLAMEAGPADDEETATNEIMNSACGGTHRLIGLAIGVNEFRAQHPGAELSSGYLAAQKRIDWAIKRAQETQLPSGAFSIAFFQRPANSANIDEHLGATGHIIEFLSFALPKERLQEPWMQRAVVYMCDLLERTRKIDLECGSLYHAAHGLVLYREKVFGPRPNAVHSDAATAGMPPQT
jgi:hypothetical protein